MRISHKIPSSQRGFTIVELLVVVVVVAILAAITIVSYNGIAARASDSARQSDTNGIAKILEIRHIETGQYGFDDSPEPVSREAFLNFYKLTSLSSSTIICNYDSCPDAHNSNWDKKKLYIDASGERFTYGYWSNADGEWKNYTRYVFNGEGFSEEFTSSAADGPFELGMQEDD